MKFKKIIYWLTLIGPILDVLKGTVVGLINVYNDVHNERIVNNIRLVENQQREQFHIDNMED